MDRETGDLIDGKLPVVPKQFTYLRYNAELSDEGLKYLGFDNINPKDVQKLDSIDYIEELQLIGKAVADKKVKEEHFPRIFDL